MNIIEILTPAYDAAWLPWAVQYFFLIAIASTAAITASCIALARTNGPAQTLLPAAMTVLVTSAVAAPIALLADLAQPGRFWHFYAHFTPWSWMSLGSALLPVFTVLTLSFAATWWLRAQRAVRILSVLLILSAISILVYTGAEIMVVRARPLWNTWFLPVNFALTGWLAALGAMLVVAHWLPGGTAALPAALMRRLGQAALMLLAVCAMAWIATGLIGTDPSFPAAIRLFKSYPVWRVSLFASLALGLVLFVMLSAVPQRLCRTAHALSCGMLMMAAAWVFRWIVLMGVQGVPKYGAGLYLHSMPLGSSGLLGIVGIFGLCIALLAMLTWFLDRFPARTGVPALHAAA